MTPLIDIDAEICQYPVQALKREWLLTNGLGGYACSSILGCNTRKYHGLLVLPLKPPLKRMVILAKYDERLIWKDKEYNLSTNYHDGHLEPDGYKYLVNFRLDPYPVFVFSIGEWEIEKRIILSHERNTVVVHYKVLDGQGAIRLVVSPLVTFRSIHEVKSGETGLNPFYTVKEGNDVLYKAGEDSPDLFFKSNAEKVWDVPERTAEIEYPVERDRGYEYLDRLLRLCELTFDLSPGKSGHIIAGVGTGASAVPLFFEEEQARLLRAYSRKSLELSPSRAKDPVLLELIRAAEDFVVKKNSDVSIIAGYPWFAIWGRDSMISLPGLLLATGRFEESRNMLLSFLPCYKDGLIPNTFPEDGEDPLYNSVDASLWFIHAVYEYYRATKDLNTVRTPLFEVIKDIIHHYIGGAKFGIHQESDGLVSAGEKGVQLTWMDAIVDDAVVTPRMGKNVEINALWYHVLRIAALFSDLFDDEEAFAAYEIHSEKVRHSFETQFWNEEGQCLYDTIGTDGPDPSIRPNQIFAVSLPHPIITGEKAQAVFDCVTRHLLTPYGLRSLAPGHPDYKPRYAGSQKMRDSAYHQGTVWPWLMGPYVDAMIHVKGPSRSLAKEGLKLLEPLFQHLQDAGLGTVSEIFDGEPPHAARGCIAQASSVAEILRVYLKLLKLSHTGSLEKEPE